jgi:4-hydroxymandelate oxidase
MDESDPAGFLTLTALESAAAARVPAGVWDYIQGGAGEERTVAANREAFQRRTLRPRALVGVETVDPSLELLRTPVRMPVFVCPMAYQGLVHPEAEAATARAAGAAGVLNVASTLSTLSLEAIAAAAPSAPRWFQLYLQPDLAGSKALVTRAEAAGYAAIVLTVDVPVLAVRDRQIRGGIAVDEPALIGNGPDVRAPPRAPEREGSRFRLRSEASATWEVVEEISRATARPVIVKGVLTGEDARKAVAHGAQGVIVSNHGGRQLDGAPSALEMLPEVAAAVGSSAEVYLDGGVRRGSDVLLAIALGARAVGVGRPVLWALAAGGEAGVARYFSLLAQEIASAMAVAGRRRLAEVDASLLGPARWGP